MERHAFENFHEILKLLAAPLSGISASLQQAAGSFDRKDF
jgi:hypothetical protein